MMDSYHQTQIYCKVIPNKNNKVTVEDISRAEYIHDKLVGLSKGKTI